MNNFLAFTRESNTTRIHKCLGISICWLINAQNLTNTRPFGQAAVEYEFISCFTSPCSGEVSSAWNLSARQMRVY